MTDSSSKLLQIQGKWYQERKPKQIPKPEQKKKSKNYSEPFLSQTSMFFFNFWLEVKQPIINKKPPAAARKKVRREAWLKLAVFPKTSSTF